MIQSQKEEKGILQSIREGTAPTVVKRQASRGAVPVSTDELLEILVFLCSDPDPTCSQQAQQTLAGWSEQKLAETLASRDISTAALAWLAARETLPDPLLQAIISHANADDSVMVPLSARLSAEQVESVVSDEGRLKRLTGFVGALLERNDFPPALRTRLEDICLQQAQEQAEAPTAPEPQAAAKAATEPEAGDKRERLSLTQKVARMSVSERVQCALKGTKDERMILIRDPSKVVYRAVLQSPKLGDAEVESFASMKNVAEEVQRIIASNRKFIKSYAVVRSLVNNPRTPIDISLTLLNRLTETDVRFLSRNRNVPETLRAMALKLSKQRGRH